MAAAPARTEGSEHGVLPFARVPRAPLRLMLRQLVGPTEQRYEMRSLHQQMCASYGPVVAQGFLGLEGLFLFGPEANRFVLLDQGRIFSSRDPWMKIMGTIFPNGLLLRDGDEHQHHRRVMHEVFKRPVLRGYADRMGPAIDAGIAGWARGGSHRVLAFDAFKALTFDMAASIFLGVELGPAARQLNEAFEAMVAAAMPGLRHPFPFGRHHRGVEGRRLMLRVLGEMLPDRRRAAGGDLLTRMAQARDERGRAFSDQDVLDHMVFLMMAAHDTTTSTLTSLAYELARHPVWQERIREECRAQGDATPGFDDLDRLEGLTLAMRETLRRYPPLPVIPRTATAAFTWGGYRIPPGTMVVISPIHTHYDPAWWSEPERFDPERFAPGRAEHERHTHSFVPFGGGTHMCLGRRFAETQVRLVMHRVLLRYRLRVPEGYVMPVQQAPISKPTDGLPLELTPLSAQEPR